MNVDSYGNLRRHYEQTTPEFPMQAYPDAVETINKLLEKYEVGIVTASARKLVIDDLIMLKFPVDRFFFIQTSEDTQVHKPDPAVFEPILKILEGKNIDKTEVLYVGDSLRDYYAARDSGIKFIGVSRGTSAKREFEGEGTEVVDSLARLLTVL